VRVTRFAAVIFDMDGVLIDSEPLHFGVLNEVLMADGHSVSFAEYEEFIGTTTDSMWNTLIERWVLARPRAEYEARYDEAIVRMLSSREWPPQPGVISLLARVRELGMRLGVASSSKRSWIEATLRSLRLGDVFEVVVAGDEVQDGKPHPEIYLRTAARLRVPPERCVAIEDSPHGTLSACQAGMSVLAVRTPYTAHMELPGAGRIVNSLAELDLTGDPFA
jgi:HAD superfamily hydrolase (TIGR01509 family)